jgi:hypothetical protein
MSLIDTTDNILMPVSVIVAFVVAGIEAPGWPASSTMTEYFGC